jgi:hypothetical protein
LSSVVVGSLIVLVSGLYLLYGFRFGAIYFLTRSSFGGMKDRAKQPGWFWAAVTEWSILLLSGLFAVAIGVSPVLRAWVRG